MNKKFLRVFLPVILIVLVFAGVTGGVVSAAARSAHQETWRTVYSVPGLETLQTPVGRALSLVKEHQQTEVYDVFPTHAVLFDFDYLKILIPEGSVSNEFPVQLSILAMSDHGLSIREIDTIELTSQNVEIGSWLTVYQRDGQQYISPEETLVVKLSCDQVMDIKIAYEAGVSIYDPDNILYIFLPLLLR